jgi:hypothetical protein
MARDISLEEARDEAVYELTAKHYEVLRRKLQGGDADIADMIDDVISHQMNRAFWREVFIDAADSTADSLIGSRFRKLVEKALKTQAEVAAIKEVEQLERQRKDSQDEARIDWAIDRAMKF